MGQQSRRHHFIPQFFSKLWAGQDERLCEYSRPYRTVVVRRKFPKGIGYEFGLYDLPGAAPEDRAFLEDRFFKLADQRACDALQAILRGQGVQACKLDGELRAAFTRLLISFHHRTPERVAAIREGMVRELEPILEYP